MKTLMILLWVALPVIHAHGEVPRTLAYQGLVTDTLGNPLPDGMYNIMLRLFDAETGGNTLWVEPQTVQLERGVFSTLLGEITPLTLPFNAQYWLGVEVENVELTPRMKLSASGYSFHSGSTESADVATLADSARISGAIPDNIVTTSKILNGAVTQAKLASGVSLPPGGTAGGDLSGSYPNPSIADLAVTTAKIASAAVTTSKINSGGASSGQALMYNGSNIVWGFPTGDLVLPYTAGISATSGSVVFSISNTATSNNVASIRGVTNSAVLGKGLQGEATSTSGENYGVFGTTASTGGYGVYGTASALSGSASGVSGRTASTTGHGVRGYADATTGFNYGVLGSSSSTGGIGVYGRGDATSGSNYGVFGASYSESGVGVAGNAYSSSGYTNGVKGVSNSSNGVGVSGIAQSSSGAAYGVWGLSNSNTGVGVYGIAQSASGSTYGVLGETVSSTGRGVFGNAGATSGTNYGVYGSTASSDGRGVYGSADATTGANFGVYGSSASSSGRGVQGFASASTGNTYGVWGQSNSPQGHGVQGRAGATSGNTVGVWGESFSTDGTGVRGAAPVYGVSGSATASSGTNFGVYGQSFSSDGRGVQGFVSATSGANYGVYGQSNSVSGYGVFGNAPFVGMFGSAFATSGTNYGMYGRSSSTSGRGVFGQAVATSGTNWGVYGLTASTLGFGVAGYATASSGLSVGVYGSSNSSLGYGVFSAGNFAASGTKSFQIDHPADPGNKYLNHYCTEGSQPFNVYSGNVTLDAGGSATVELPAYVEQINKDFRYQLTPIGAPAPNLFVAEEIQGRTFRIAGGQPGIRVSWRIEAVRNDLWVQRHGAPAEMEKPAEHRGKYLQPELYGMPKELGIHFVEPSQHEIRTPDLLPDLSTKEDN